VVATETSARHSRRLQRSKRGRLRHLLDGGIATSPDHS
jgi:hypothetical protein